MTEKNTKKKPKLKKMNEINTKNALRIDEVLFCNTHTLFPASNFNLQDGRRSAVT